MNPLERSFSLRVLPSLLACLLSCACAKKAAKPQHSAPWLAHPSAAAALPDAAAPSVPFQLAAKSQLSFELKTKQSRARGSVKTLSGVLELSPQNLAATRGRFTADLRTLVVQGGAGEDPAATARALRALDVSADAGADGVTSATFELSALEDLSAPSLAAPHARDGGSGERHLRATAVGELSLHGFRVSARVPVEAEVSFALGGEPAGLVIRSRAPLVISLATHQIASHGSEPLPRDARVSFEFTLEK